MYPTRSKDGPANAITGKVRPQYLVKPDWKSAGSWPTPLLTQVLAVHSSLPVSIAWPWLMGITSGSLFLNALFTCCWAWHKRSLHTFTLTEHQLNLGISWRGLIKRLRHQTVKISKKVLTKKGQRIIYEHKKKMRLRQLKSLRISIQLFNAFDVWIR